MKRNSIWIIPLLLLAASCATLDYTRVTVEVPIKTVLDLEKLEEVIITDFFIKKEAEDFDMNQELVNFFTTEIKQTFKGAVRSQKTSFENEQLFRDSTFWKNLQPDSQGAVFFTGIVEYNKEVRKAILETKKKGTEDPFSRDEAIEERRFYTLNLDLYIIDTQTGETIYSRTFKESQGYKNPKQTGPFAFYELTERVKQKFLTDIFGGSRRQQRYLIKD
ncbi:MAG: hypothetical protein PVI11_08485 [Candidatus Aminicenantes bacterium]|jgi:hypothetical protein